ncbi:DUF1345 domain-containing protein [Actinospica durhamensis]|uniref:DUF1345 domain-containing protein n=1 Tax=Actinospica durhamensis TaxID=1508375 RepID=A0A941EMR8_9ACTN|nr:DUF1345 domain-containing protein [Actinospica durhamensis]MBR7831879.1 DUF1345 domain-containing protein [Actinospica durhamensis]
MDNEPAGADPDPRAFTSARTKLLSCCAAGIAAGSAAAVLGTGREAPLIGWGTFAVIYCLWMWASVWHMDAPATAAHANTESPGRDLADVVVLGASIVSLIAVGLVLFDAGGQSGATKYVQAALAVASVITSWILVHTVFTLKYARLYYQDPVGGIDFNEDDRPQYTDFAYLAFTIGMTFQVSDTDLQTKAVRRAALRHALISFPLGTVIIATSVNLVAGLAK